MNNSVLVELPVLEQTEIEKLIAAFDDRRNTPAASLLAYAGVQTASGVIVRLIIAGDEEQEMLLRLIHAALAEQERLEA
ncbi:MAG TPA: hypothetical protein VMS98_18300 [Thermoanaerobaculia bacterium]|nr:hypothetical protein [Thermoanaerobaculia bacterium]